LVFELVFDVVADPDMAAKHVPNIVAIRDRSPGPLGAGSTWRQRMRVAGQETEVSVRVVEFQRPQRCTIAMQGLAGMRAHITLEVQPQEGGARVVQTFDYQPPGGALGALAAGLFVDRMIERDIEENLRILKRVVEEMAAGGRPSEGGL
jgi:uncharacterized membrane protein